MIGLIGSGTRINLTMDQMGNVQKDRTVLGFEVLHISITGWMDIVYVFMEEYVQFLCN